MPDEMNQQPIQADPTPPQAPTQPAASQAGTSGMGIASLVLGILAILTSFLPIINNGSFFLALLGLIFAIVGLIVTSKGKKGGKGLAIAGLVLNVLSIIIVLATQSMYSAALDKASEELESGTKPVAATQAQSAAQNAGSTGGTQEQAQQQQQEQGQAQEQAQSQQAAAEEPAAEEQAAAEEKDYSNMALGDSVQFKDGLQVSVDEVITGLSNYNGDPITGITVTYVNNGEKNLSFNPYDWKAQDVNGIIDSMTFYMDGENPLNSGQLTPGSSITGNLYFDGELAKALYYSNIFQSNSEIAWNLQ